MNIILYFNFFILAGLVLLLLREELRFRRFSKTVKDTKADLTMIVHQLRSPLGNLRKFTDFLQCKEFGNLSFSQQEAISSVQTSLTESLLLLDRLLGRSRLDEGKVTLQSASLHLRDIVQGVLDAVMPITKKKKHVLTMKGGKGLQVFTDPLLLHAILDEIISNAIYYTPDGGKIEVSISDQGNSVAVEVIDTGIGISDEERPHVFEKFFRGERAKPLHPGNGLGLAFAKQFTERLGGTIQFRSTEEKGSAFTVLMPKKPVYRLD